MKSLFLIVAGLLGLLGILLLISGFLLKSVFPVINHTTEVNGVSTSTPLSKPNPLEPQKLSIMKDFGESYKRNFGLTEEDFQILKDSHIEVVEGNFDTCTPFVQVQQFLDLSKKYGLKVIMPAGSGQAEWGYDCNRESFPKTQKPVWNKADVTTWVNKWKDHPAVYMWDISNEAGSDFPNSEKEYYITVQQLQAAYKNIKEIDQNHKIATQMNGWIFYDNERDFFKKENPFAQNVADVVMINSYSNVEEYSDDFVSVVTARAKDSIYAVDYDTQLFVVIGAWEEKPLWVKPTLSHFQNDFVQANEAEIQGIGYFKYGAKDSDWYLPKNSPALLQKIADYSKKYE